MVGFFQKGILNPLKKQWGGNPIRVVRTTSSTLSHESGRKPGPAVQKKCQNSRKCELWCRYARNEVQWAHLVSSPSSLHTFLISKENCIVKVEFTNRNCTLFSRYSRMKVHMRNADSNLAALIRALKCLQPIQTLDYAFLVQTNESEIARVQPLLRFS